MTLRSMSFRWRRQRRASCSTPLIGHQSFHKMILIQLRIRTIITMKCPKSNLSTESSERLQNRGKQISAKRQGFSYGIAPRLPRLGNRGATAPGKLLPVPIPSSRIRRAGGNRSRRGRAVPDVERAKSRFNLIIRVKDRLGPFYLTLN